MTKCVFLCLCLFVFFSSLQYFSSGVCFMSFCVFFFVKFTKVIRLIRYNLMFNRIKKTQKHITICCVFVFFCLKSSWLFLPCVFCVFVFFSCSNCSLVTFVPFIFVMFFVLPDHQFCRFSSSSNFHFFGTCSMCCCLFCFISCLVSANPFLC